LSGGAVDTATGSSIGWISWLTKWWTEITRTILLMDGSRSYRSNWLRSLKLHFF